METILTRDPFEQLGIDRSRYQLEIERSLSYTMRSDDLTSLLEIARFL